MWQCTFWEKDRKVKRAIFANLTLPQQHFSSLMSCQDLYAGASVHSQAHESSLKSPQSNQVDAVACQNRIRSPPLNSRCPTYQILMLKIHSSRRALAKQFHRRFPQRLQQCILVTRQLLKTIEKVNRPYLLIWLCPQPYFTPCEIESETQIELQMPYF